MRFLVEWLVDDINPQWLPEADRRKINALKSSLLHGADNAHTTTVARFLSEIEKIEKDPAQFERMIGTDDEAQKRWKELKGVYTKFAEEMKSNRKYAMTDAKREILREYSKGSGGFAARIMRKFRPGG